MIAHLPLPVKQDAVEQLLSTGIPVLIPYLVYPAVLPEGLVLQEEKQLSLHQACRPQHKLTNKLKLTALPG